MSEETLALRVDEATMQDWLAAVTMIKFAPPSTYSTAPFDPHPEPIQRAPARRAAAARRPAAKPAPTLVAGARSFYWLGLALALGLFVLL